MSLQSVATKAFITGLCSTAGTVLILGISWKLFYPHNNNNEINDVNNDTEIDIETDTDTIDNGENNHNFKKLFDEI